jgi:YVTN family beta-propeller protein
VNGRVAGLIAVAVGLLGAAAAPLSIRYKSPIEVALSTDGARLYVVCEESGELVVVNVATGAVTARAAAGRMPKGLAQSGDGRFLYVANSWSDTVSEIDAKTLQTRRTLGAGFEPTSVAISADGRTLYTANRIGGNISAIDLGTGEETRRLTAGRGASYLALSPDGGQALYATHILPNIGAHRTAPISEITVVNTGLNAVTARLPLPNAAGVFHIALSADGRLGIACNMRPKNLVPLAHVAHGWAITSAVTLFGKDVDGEAVQLPLDEIDRYYSLPFSVAIAPDKRAAYVATSNSDSVTVLDVARMLEVVRRASPRERARLANDLSLSANYVVARIPVGANPKGMALSADGARLYVANRLDDTVSVIDTAARRVVRTIKLGGPAVLSKERRGARLFHTARFSFQGQFGCANCHIEDTFDGLQWDLEPDGFGIDIVDNRLLEDVADTAPFKWNGGNPNLETECGVRTEKFFYRSQSFTAAELADLVAFIKSVPLRPNRYRLANGELTPQQERGKAIYERTTRKDGAPIPPELQCPVCHSGPHYTDRQLTDVGSGKATDRSAMIDVPQLTNVVLTAPYLHDGSARTLEEIWTVFNPRDTHGVTNDLAKDELNDLIEYLKTL